MRLFDYFLAYDHKPGTEFLLPLYLIVSILEHWKDDILEQECEMAALHSFFYRVSYPLTFSLTLLQEFEKNPKKYILEVIRSSESLFLP